MESNKIDQLFRNNLNRHQVKPGKDAWSSLSSQLPTHKASNKKAFFWSIAASICLLIACVLFIKDWSVNEQLNNQLGFSVQFDNEKNAVTNDKELAAISLPKASEKKNIVKLNSAINTPLKKKPANVGYQYKTSNQLAQKDERVVLKKVNPTTDDIEGSTLFDSGIHLSNIQTQLIVVNSYHNNTINSTENDIEKESNTILKTKDKIKSLASELSIADLRSAKNELFASALQIEKKHTN